MNDLSFDNDEKTCIMVMGILYELLEKKLVTNGEWEITPLGISIFDQLITEKFVPDKELFIALLKTVCDFSTIDTIITLFNLYLKEHGYETVI